MASPRSGVRARPTSPEMRDAGTPSRRYLYRCRRGYFAIRRRPTCAKHGKNPPCEREPIKRCFENNPCISADIGSSRRRSEAAIGTAFFAFASRCSDQLNTGTATGPGSLFTAASERPAAASTRSRKSTGSRALKKKQETKTSSSTRTSKPAKSSSLSSLVVVGLLEMCAEKIVPALRLNRCFRNNRRFNESLDRSSGGPADRPRNHSAKKKPWVKFSKNSLRVER